ncbi:murein biosynthesis integral membrane protein MurJ [Oryzihumus leptocrescens]|uniref:murein biosynthesis integral membrane protein MurJ n=1 Tax=Oryzihumus leptocrescens TaxID=297536 RepID=UPI00163B520C|nr:lipid II flippase MurJ [Oryzihumus leptocrescens]
MSPAPSRRAHGLLAAAGLIAVVTLAARVVGFGRWLVFSHSVGVTCVGNVYQTANQLPNVIYEVAAGGALAAIAVPVIAGQLGQGDRESADRTASAMLTWALTLLVPLALLVAALAGPLTSAMLGPDVCRSQPGAAAELGATMLVVFAPQVALYGVGIVLAGVLQAHHRFLGAALAPLLSSLVVIAAYVLYGALSGGHGNDPAHLPAGAAWALSAGTTMGVVALSLPLLVPVRRAGVRLRLTWRFPDGVARRAASLAGAGLVALLAQQAAVLATVWVTNYRSGNGTLNVYTYVQAVYLLPYAVLAVPLAISTFPTLAAQAAQEGVSQEEAAAEAVELEVFERESVEPDPPEREAAAGQVRNSGLGAPAGADGGAAGTDDDASRTLARSTRAVAVAGVLGAAVLLVASRPLGAFFTALDAGRHQPVGRAALQAMPVAMDSYAVGLVGFGLAAVLTRALYVRGRPRIAAVAVAAGWLVAALWPLLALTGPTEPTRTLRTLGVASSAGMTLTGVLLLVAVRQAWGAPALRGLPRTLVAALVAAVVSVAPGRVLADALPTRGLLPSVLVGVLVASVTVVVFVAVLALADRETGRLLTARLRSRVLRRSA